MQDRPSPGYVTLLARRLRRNQTSAEQALWACLRNRQLGNAKFRRQQPFGRYILDFYCSESHLAVELEGSVHDQANQVEYDAVRYAEIEQAGIKVLAFKNEEVFQDLERVLTQIGDALTPSPSP